MEETKNKMLEELKDKPKTVYLPFSGGSTYGKGIIKEKDVNDTNIHNFIFENEKGKIYFNTFNDRKVKGIEFVFTKEQLNEYTNNVIHETLSLFISTPKNSNLNIFEQISNKFKL